jgi:hypothetical protein
VSEIGLLFLAAIIGFITKELLGRGVRRSLRWRSRKAPLVTHVETDPSIVWAGMPPWIGAGFLVPTDADTSSPPAHCLAWRTWALAKGGVDEGMTQVRVTLTARESLLVVVDGVRVKVHHRMPSPPWRSIVCGVGGADITPRRGEIDLSLFDPPGVQWLDESGDTIGMPTFSLTATEADVLHLWAQVAEDEWVEWSAELLVLVYGERQLVPITDAGKPFITAGGGNASSQHMAISGVGEWSPPI